jgi:hypothetical protein
MTAAPSTCDHSVISEFIETIKVKYLLYIFAPARGMTAGLSANAIGYDATFVDDINLPPAPVPAAAWLFGSAMFALLGLRRRSRIG